MFEGPLSHSILRIAQEKKKIHINYVNIRDFGIGKHKLVDDTPYGGGIGMVMRVDVIDKALKNTKCNNNCKERVILLDPQGIVYTQAKAKSFTSYNHLIFICGRYEGVDERVRTIIDEEISIGDYVLTGGELPTMVIIDSVARLLPGVLGKDTSSHSESFQTSVINKEEIVLLEYPQYTKPNIYKSQAVPEVLLSGNHAKIAQWRDEQALKKTKNRRPDLLIKRS